MAKKRSGTKSKTKKPKPEAAPAVETAPAAQPQGETAAAVSSDAVNAGSPMVKDLGPAAPPAEPTPAPAAAVTDSDKVDEANARAERAERHLARVRQLAERHRSLQADVDQCKLELSSAKEAAEKAATAMELAALEAEEPLLFDEASAPAAEAPKPRKPRTDAKPTPAAEPEPERTAWRDASVDELIPLGLSKAAAKALQDKFDHAATLGRVADYVNTPGQRLTDLKGFKGAAAEKFAIAQTAWFNANPTKAPAVKSAPREATPEHTLEWTKGSAEGEIMARSVWEKEDKTPLRFTIYTNGADVWLSGDTELVAQPMNCGPHGTDLAKAEAQQRENQIVHNANRGIRKPAEATAAEPLKGGGVEGSATVGGAIAAAAEKTDGDNLSDETIDRGARLAITAGKGSRDMFVNLMGLTLAEGHVLVDTLVHLKLLGDHIAPPATDRHVLMTLEEWEAASAVQPAHV